MGQGCGCLLFILIVIFLISGEEVRGLMCGGYTLVIIGGFVVVGAILSALRR